MADSFKFQKFEKPSTGFQSIGDEEKGTLVVSGYLKGGIKMSANLLVHLPYFGDFQLIKIVATDDPCAKERISNNMGDENSNEERVLHQFDPQERDNLEFENVPDPLAGEQNWPEEQDLKDDSFEEIENAAKKFKKKRVPKGTSDYQSSWFLDESSSGEGESESESDEQESKNNNQTENKNLQISSKNEKDDVDDEDEESMEDENKNPKTGVRFVGKAQQIESSEDDDQMSVQESHMSIKIKDRSNHTLEELEREQLDWPDEVNVPYDSRASVRFQKYRGLKSFRTSPWDPKVNFILIWFF